MWRICFSLFLTGVVLGAGPCLASCGPILISYIAATKRSVLGGLKSWFVFSISRVLAYIFLGLIAGLAGSALFRSFYWEAPAYIIWISGGTFILILGLLILLGAGSSFKLCSVLNESLIQRDTKSLITLGILIGIFPCVPLLGILSYITMMSTRPSHGILMSASFGIGTVVSPLFFFCMIAGLIPRLKVLQNQRALSIFQKAAALVLFVLGAHIIVKALIEFIKPR